MSNSGDVQQNSSEPVGSRSVVPTKGSSAPAPSSLLMLGQLRSVSDGGGDGGADMTSLRDQLRLDWAPSGMVNFWLLTDGAFLIQFYEKADLDRVVQGAPWSCGPGGDLFDMALANPDKELLHQVVRFAMGSCTACSSTTSPSPPCTHTPVGPPRSGEWAPFIDLVAASPSPGEVFRCSHPLKMALVRSRSVDLDGSRREVVVPPAYEPVSTLCLSCGIIEHPAGRCRRRRRNQQPWLSTPTVAMTRRDKQKPAGYIPSRLGSRTLSPWVHEIEDADDHSGGRTADPGRPTPRTQLPPEGEGEGEGEGEVEEPSSAASESPPKQELTSRPVIGIARCLSCTNKLLKQVFTRKRKTTVGKASRDSTGHSNCKHNTQPKDKPQTAQQIAANQGVQVIDSDKAPTDGTFALRSPSQFKLRGGFISYSGQITKPRIEVTVETQLTPHQMVKAMEWLSEHAGLQASYDDNKGKISIFGLPIGAKMGPLDLVVYLYPEACPRTGLTEGQQKPDTPDRFEVFMQKVHHVNCCRATSMDSCYLNK